MTDKEKVTALLACLPKDQRMSATLNPMAGSRLTAKCIGLFIANLSDAIEGCRRDDEPEVTALVDSLTLDEAGALTIGVVVLLKGDPET